VHVRRRRLLYFATLPIDDGERFASWLLTDFRLDGETLMVSPGDGFTLQPAWANRKCALPMCWQSRHWSGL
jgi:hypothetical protein